MHMADALVSPAVGGVLFGISTGILAYCIRDVKTHFDESKVSLMGIMGAFVFAAQMINFTIPGTGSSGHIGGAVLLAALLGPSAAFLVLSCVLLVQALFFADGGLLAWGCNAFNMGFFGCFVAVLFLYRPFIRKKISSARIMAGSILACVVSLQFGAFCVVLETLCSGITQLPFDKFVPLMQGIHLAIGVIEGILTGSVLIFLRRANPGFLADADAECKRAFRPGIAAAVLLLGAFVIGGGLSLLASGNPDGLEWSVQKVAGSTELEASGGIHLSAGELQNQTAFMPDYGFKDSDGGGGGTAAAGLIGSAITLIVALGLGWFLRKKAEKKTV